MRSRTLPLLAALAALLAPGLSRAVEEGAADLAMAQAAFDPVAEVIDLAVRNETMFDIGHKSRTANYTYLEPSFPSVGPAASLGLAHAFRLPLAWQPVNVARTGGTYGLGDFDYTLYVTPARQGAISFGVGGTLHVPTSTDDTIGDHKWAAGPAASVSWSSGPVHLGLVADQLFTFASTGSYPDVNRLTLRPSVSVAVGHGLAVLTAPILTADWDRASADRFTVPLGGGLQKVWSFGGTRLAITLQAYWNVVRPTAEFVSANPLVNVPTWTLRSGVNVLLPR